MKSHIVSRVDHPETEGEQKPFWQHRRWQLSAGFLAVVLCVGVVMLIADGDEVVPGAAAAGPVIGELRPDGSRPQQCRTDDVPQTIPASAPQDVTWWVLNGAPAPRSASAGPLKATGPLRWCFAHTPLGAVMAANVIPRQMSGPDWRVVTRQQLVPGLSRDYYESMRESITDSAAPRSTISVAGFSVVAYSSTTATIQILVRQARVNYASVDYTVDWDGVDWKLRPLNTGELYTAVSAVYSVAGFVLWKGP